MASTILIGRGKKILDAPEDDWRKELAKAPRFFASRLAFMTDDHHRVRNYVVSELPRHHGEPLVAGQIARALGLPESALDAILGDLERNLFFLVRDEAGSVVWGFPVTAARTGHRVRFDSGESAFAA